MGRCWTTATPLNCTGTHFSGSVGSAATAIATTAQHQQSLRRLSAQTSEPQLLHHPSAPLDYPQPPFRLPQPPFRNRAADTLQRPLRRLSTARLWNPTNSTPRGVASSSSTTRQQQLRPQKQHAQLQPQRLHSGVAGTSTARRRAPSTPPPPAVPLSHPVLDGDKPVARDDLVGTGAADFPLLTLPEQRQIRHTSSPRASLQVERAGSEKRVSLPKSVRHSYEGKRLSALTIDAADDNSGAEPDILAASRLQDSSLNDELFLSSQQQRGNDREAEATDSPTQAFGLTFDSAPGQAKLDKGKSKATLTDNTMASPVDDERPGGAGRSFSKDLERGPDVLGHHHGLEESQNNRDSTASLPDGMGIGSAISSSNSSIMGDPEAQPDIGEEWGPQHPCFPHRNPHVSVDDPEYITTRIIRIRRDWLIMGDLAPTFSNLYPEILDPAGMNEPEFRRVIDKLNRELTIAFEPWSARNIVDGVLGLVTGWLWEDFGFTGAKARLARLERWIEAWNKEMARTADEGAPVPPKIIPLRQTGYMTLDIQIGDPEIAAVPPSTPAISQSGLPLEATVAS
ncbi:hypothetical protein SPBR_02395 [Sporothrix brasiliensis 5110]|uniref:Ras modification protein ERF4 n=1 Tax=Sporothrix brasiliensis 5110 TaxID=1398154 RepID=A0A0C2IUT7_9PEZI|nr:uncharacterized protein SPBR_02395 [Sporothrix brasiliensis 5110]KIH92921.1 hypothetical protein SPBR_02395 [Sporothrix brasiliensis 5110]